MKAWGRNSPLTSVAEDWFPEEAVQSPSLENFARSVDPLHKIYQLRVARVFSFTTERQNSSGKQNRK